MSEVRLVVKLVSESSQVHIPIIPRNPHRATRSGRRTAKQSRLTFQLSPDNLDTDPLFSTARNPALAPTTAVGDARLQSSSPVIDGDDYIYLPLLLRNG